VDDDFLVGYASNAHGYRVFNNVIGLVEIVVDVTFDKIMACKGKFLVM
jgi:hypothetical protein